MAGTAKKTKIPNFLLISILLNLLVSVNVNPPAEFRPCFALKSFAAVRPAILSGRSQRRRLIIPAAPQAGSPLRSDKHQGILAKANKI